MPLTDRCILKLLKEREQPVPAGGLFCKHSSFLLQPCTNFAQKEPLPGKRNSGLKNRFTKL